MIYLFTGIAVLAACSAFYWTLVCYGPDASTPYMPASRIWLMSVTAMWILTSCDCDGLQFGTANRVESHVDMTRAK